MDNPRKVLLNCRLGHSTDPDRDFVPFPMRESTSQPGAVERFSAANGRVKPWGQFNLSGRPYVVLRIEAAGDVRMQRRDE